MNLEYAITKLRQSSAKLGILIKKWNLRFGTANPLVESANGVSGCLLRTYHGYIFRVYDKNSNEFVDYDLTHSDLHVTIQDTDAYFYKIEDSNVLDHSPATLGIDK